MKMTSMPHVTNQVYWIVPNWNPICSNTRLSHLESYSCHWLCALGTLTFSWCCTFFVNTPEGKTSELGGIHKLWKLRFELKIVSDGSMTTRPETKTKRWPHHLSLKMVTVPATKSSNESFSSWTSFLTVSTSCWSSACSITLMLGKSLPYWNH